VLFQSEDWQARCQQIVDTFNDSAWSLYDARPWARAASADRAEPPEQGPASRRERRGMSEPL
jgi:hypothetical protein